MGTTKVEDAKKELTRKGGTYMYMVINVRYTRNPWSIPVPIPPLEFVEDW